MNQKSIKKYKFGLYFLIIVLLILAILFFLYGEQFFRYIDQELIGLNQYNNLDLQDNNEVEDSKILNLELLQSTKFQKLKWANSTSVTVPEGQSLDLETLQKLLNSENSGQNIKSGTNNPFVFDE